jgi:DNA-binding transcriptional regulator LsrR (DeoR family)
MEKKTERERIQEKFLEIQTQILVQKWTQQALADAVGVSVPTICKKLQNPEKFKVSEYVRVCEVLNLQS